MLFLLATCLPATALTTPAPRLLYAEPLAELPSGAALRRRGGNAAHDTAELRFDAFGRRFDLRLVSNPRLSAATDDATFEKGTLAGVSGSWVRLTRFGENIVGLIHDGQEIYAIEPTADLAPFLDPAVPLPAATNLIYRLSDLLIEPDLLSCGVPRSAQKLSAASALQALVAELDELQTANAIVPLRRIRVAPVADFEFSQRYGSGAVSALLARLNIAEGIFREQVGIDFAVGTPEIFGSEAPPYPFTSTDAPTLLDQISDYRLQQHGESGLTHLFTGKSLDNRLAGIAWQDSVCMTRRSAALSTSAGLTGAVSALVAAHEIGHNFGAPHDAEAGSACATEPDTYLMAPRVSESSEFSPCSLNKITTLIATRSQSYPSCLVALLTVDIAASGPGSLQANPGDPVPFDIVLDNLGATTVDDVGLEVTLPADLTVLSVTPESGACSIVAGTISCTIESLPPEASWAVALAVTTETTGIYSINARVFAAGDERLSNDAVQFSITIGNPGQGAATGGGGGGPIDTLLLALLLLGTTMKRRRNR